jgi:hypothetical protein
MTGTRQILFIQDDGAVVAGHSVGAAILINARPRPVTRT